MNYPFKIMAVVLVLGVFSINANANSKCGKIKIAEMNWASAELIANIDKIILEEKFGCQVELVSGATIPTFNSMQNQNGPDIAPEMWVNGIIKPLNKSLNNNTIFIANNEPIPKLGEYWFVSPNVLKNNPEIKTILDVINRPDLFPHPENKSKGAFVGCPKGWGCYNVNANLFRAFEMDKKGWILVNPGSASGLDGSIARTIERGKNWFGYYWAPTSLVGKYNLKNIDFGVSYAGNMNWDRCMVKSQINCQNPKKTSWVKSEVFTLTNKNMSNKPNIFKYLSNRKIPVSVMNQMMYAMAAKRMSGRNAANYFLNKYKPIKLSWFNNDNKNKYVDTKPKTEFSTKPKPTISSAELEVERQKRIELERKIAALEGKQKQEQQKIDTDTRVPFLEIISNKTKGKRGTITGIARDNIEVAEVTVDGKPVTLSFNGNFNYSTYVPPTGLELNIQVTDISGLTSSKTVVLKADTLIADSSISFDRLNPLGKRVKNNKNALALIVGVSNYENTKARALYADNDAMVFKDYATEKLGISENKIKMLINDGADYGEILLITKDWLRRASKANKSDIYIFFAGHGLASDDGKNMYLLPYDGRPRLLDKTALLRDELFKEIQQSNPRSVTVFLDTCYSGTTRGTDMLVASRPIMIKAKEQSIPSNFTVFSAAAGDQTSKPLEEAKHGMFSYFLMKGMEGDADTNNDNKITARELHAYVEQNVVQQSSGSQTPELQGDKDRVLVQFN